MKKRYLIVGSLAFFQYFAKAQSVKDTTVEKVNKTEVELVYNHYLQDGDNSAVTGGKGTEKLTVYGPSLDVKKTADNNAYAFKIGADIISSASTDKIDFVSSSASKLDTRFFANTNYERQIENSVINSGIGLSIESDYFSIASQLGFSKTDKDGLRTYSVNFQMFNDDLRWGRLNPDYYEPVKLIYPSELRNKEWFDTYKRNSYNLKLGLIQVLNKRNVLGIFPELTYQKGLLSTPFHRVYFTDESLAVENLPNERIKEALSVRLNSFLGGRLILKNTLNLYNDNFGIFAFAIENETAIKIKSSFTLLPGVRFYAQQEAKYFAPYKAHDVAEKYYTSDYDLSQFENYGLGLGVKYSILKYLDEKRRFSTLIFRYNYSHRSNGLNAHILSLVVRMETEKEGK